MLADMTMRFDGRSQSQRPISAASRAMRSWLYFSSCASPMGPAAFAAAARGWIFVFRVAMRIPFKAIL